MATEYEKQIDDIEDQVYTAFGEKPENCNPNMVRFVIAYYILGMPSIEACKIAGYTGTSLTQRASALRSMEKVDRLRIRIMDLLADKPEQPLEKEEGQRILMSILRHGKNEAARISAYKSLFPEEGGDDIDNRGAEAFLDRLKRKMESKPDPI